MPLWKWKKVKKLSWGYINEGNEMQVLRLECKEILIELKRIYDRKGN